MEIILKKETSLGLESCKDLGFNSEEELNLKFLNLLNFDLNLILIWNKLIAVQKVKV